MRGNTLRGRVQEDTPTSAMKILYLLPHWIFPPNSGPKHLTYNLIKFISRHHECHLAGFYEDKDSLFIKNQLPNVKILRFFQKSKGFPLRLSQLFFMLKGSPASLARYKNDEFQSWLKMQILTENYDLVHFDTFNMSLYHHVCHQLPSVLIASDAYSMGYKRGARVVHSPFLKLRYLHTAWLLEHFERCYYPNFTKVCTVSDVDTQYLRTNNPNLDVETIEIPVGEEFLSLPDAQMYKDGNPQLLCVGLLSAPCIGQGTLDFLRKVYPAVVNAVPDVKLTVWGRNPVPALRRKLRTMPTVRYIDFVEDYIGELSRAWVYVYPQRCGSGCQTKVQQAMALGIPVVGSPEAFGGIAAEHGKHVFICKTPGEFTEAIVNLLRNREIRRQLGTAARELIREHYLIEVIGPKMVSIYNQAIAKFSSTFS